MFWHGRFWQFRNVAARYGKFGLGKLWFGTFWHVLAVVAVKVRCGAVRQVVVRSPWT